VYLRETGLFWGHFTFQLFWTKLPSLFFRPKGLHVEWKMAKQEVNLDSFTSRKFLIFRLTLCLVCVHTHELAGNRQRFSFSKYSAEIWNINAVYSNKSCYDIVFDIPLWLSHKYGHVIPNVVRSIILMWSHRI
jgi:hypothetical protein